MNDETATPSRLVVQGLYNHFGQVMIALDGETMVPVAGPDTTKYVQGTESPTLLAHPGSNEWTSKMASVRHRLVRDLAAARAEVSEKQTWIDNLGEALLAEATERDWCDEYDEFAERWDLPLRLKEFNVSMNVLVKARGSEAALDYVRENVSIGEYDDEVVSAPDFHVENS